jgi:uncharacterized RDD family membrane protein YckC
MTHDDQPGGPATATALLAPPQLRLLAFVVDVACVAIALMIPVLVGTLAGVTSIWLFALILAISLVVYFALMVWLTGGQTIGKALFELRVRRIDGSVPTRTARGLAWSLGRHSVGYLVADVFGVGLLLALVTPRRRCLHDYAFGSEVVIEPTDGEERSCPLLVRVRAFGEQFKATVEQLGKRNTGPVFLWKWLTKLVMYTSLAVIALADTNPESRPGRMWNWVQRRLARLIARAPSAHATPPAKALSVPARVGLWAGTAAVAGSVVAVVVPIVGQPDHLPSLRVPATAAIYSAGQPSVLDEQDGETLPPGRPVTEGTVLRFNVTGRVACQPPGPFLSPDGGDCAPPLSGLTNLPSSGSISGIENDPDDMFLVGVFTSGAPPAGSPRLRSTSPARAWDMTSIVFSQCLTSYSLLATELAQTLPVPTDSSSLCHAAQLTCTLVSPTIAGQGRWAAAFTITRDAWMSE